MNCPESNQKLWQTGETRTAKRSMQGQNGDGPSSPLQAEPRAHGGPGPRDSFPGGERKWESAGLGGY